MSARCLEFTILTAARSGEAIGARWEEFELDEGIWTVPASRMKAGREHRVPLSERAREIITSMREVRSGEYVFPGQKLGRPMSNMALEMLMRRLKVADTVHGFRSSFRDWAAEQTNFPREVAEAALAHVISNEVEAACRRSDLLEKRRTLLGLWSDFVEDRRSETDKVANS
jgi:integrase